MSSFLRIHTAGIKRNQMIPEKMLLLKQVRVKSQSNKTIYHVYLAKYKEGTIYPGLGDFLRGSLALIQVGLLYNINVVIDFSQHPIGSYIISDKQCKGSVKELISTESFVWNHIINFLTSTESSFYVSTNIFPLQRTIDTATRNKIQQYIQFTPDIMAEYNDILTSYTLEKQNYFVIHMRILDNHASTIFTNIDMFVSAFKTMPCITNTSFRVIIMSNNMYIKHKMKELYPHITVINTVPCHTGLSSNVKDTLLDFLIMSTAKHIIQLTPKDHWWGSGFSDMCANIYSIPVTSLKY